MPRETEFVCNGKTGLLIGPPAVTKDCTQVTHSGANVGRGLQRSSELGLGERHAAGNRYRPRLKTPEEAAAVEFRATSQFLRRTETPAASIVGVPSRKTTGYFSFLRQEILR
jgi:hypothetical protein